jgi:hypothetical protein
MLLELFPATGIHNDTRHLLEIAKTQAGPQEGVHFDEGALLSAEVSAMIDTQL